MGYLKWLQDTRIMNEEGGDTGTGSGGAPSAAPTFTSEQQAAINAQVAAAVTQAVDATNAKRDAGEAGLKKNRDEILAQKKQLTQDLIDKDLSLQMLDGDVEGVRNQITAELQGVYDEKVNELQSTLDKTIMAGDNEFTDNLLDKYLTDLMVKSSYQSDMKTGLLSRAKIEKAEDGSRSLIIEGKPAAEYFSEWSKSEVAKDFVVAPSSSGGGGLGSSVTNGSASTFELLQNRDGADLISAAMELDNKK